MARLVRDRPTMIDVALAAGVALKSVSRVVNGEKVRPHTQAAVEKAIRDLGYRRNEGAAALRSGQSRTIAFIANDIGEASQLALADAIEDALAEEDFRLVVASTRGERAREEGLFRAFCGNGINGLIVLPTVGEQSYMRLDVESGVHVVFVDRPAKGITADSVLSTNRDGAREATERLLAAGHRRIGYFSMETDLYTGRERLRGYRDAVRRSGLNFDAQLVANTYTSREALLEAYDAMNALDDPPTAFLSATSRISKNLLWVFRVRGARPSFVGFDDFELADVLTPSVSVVAQDSRKMGQVAAKLLLDRMRGAESSPQQVEVKTQWRERESVRPAISQNR